MNRSNQPETVSIGIPSSNVNGAAQSSQGEILTQGARDKKEATEKVRALLERCSVLGKPAAQYVCDVMTGADENLKAEVPQEYVTHLVSQGYITPQFTVTQVGLDAGVPLRVEETQAAFEQVPEVQSTYPQTIEVEAQEVNKTAPPSPNLAAQPQQANPHSVEEMMRKFNPQYTAPQTEAALMQQFGTMYHHLENPLWRNVENQIMFEEVVDGLINRNSTFDQNSENTIDSGKRMQIMQAVQRMIAEIEQFGVPHLRALHLHSNLMTLFYKNRRRLLIPDTLSAGMRSAIESKIGSIQQIAESFKGGESGNVEEDAERNGVEETTNTIL